MNLNEIKQPSDKALFEAIDKENDTGFLTEDLVKIARAKTGTWSEPMTGEQLDEQIRQICGG